MKVLPAINQKAAIYIHGLANKPVVIMPPAYGKAPTPVEINEKDERVMKFIKKYLEEGKIREFKGETETAIEAAEKEIPRIEGELEKAQDTAIKAKENHDAQVIRLNNETTTLEGMDKPTKTQEKKVVAAQTAFDKAELALSAADEDVANLSNELEAANDELARLTE